MCLLIDLQKDVLIAEWPIVRGADLIQRSSFTLKTQLEERTTSSLASLINSRTAAHSAATGPLSGQAALGFDASTATAESKRSGSDKDKDSKDKEKGPSSLPFWDQFTTNLASVKAQHRNRCCSVHQRVHQC